MKLQLHITMDDELTKFYNIAKKVSVVAKLYYLHFTDSPHMGEHQQILNNGEKLDCFKILRFIELYDSSMLLNLLKNAKFKGGRNWTHMYLDYVKGAPSYYATLFMEQKYLDVFKQI